jgi:hypothetical protein
MGTTIALHGTERIRVTPPEVRQAIREHREEILTLLEAFEDRAGIVKVSAGLERQAEALAWRHRGIGTGRHLQGMQERLRQEP